MRCRMNSIWLVLFTSVLLTGGCTDNPFEGDATIQAGDRTISGVVQLSDSDDHSGVYVWMEGFDIATTTDAEGRFSLTLPPPSSQTSGGGVDGIFNVYTFLGNYRLQRTRTAVRDGAFVFPSTDIDDAGRIVEPILLLQKIDIQIDLDRTHIEADSPRFIAVEVQLKSNAQPSTAYFPRMYGRIEGPILLHNLRTGKVEIYSTTVVGIDMTDHVSLGPVPYKRTLLLNIPKYALKAGIYEVLPFIVAKNEVIPLHLLNSLGVDVTALSEEYVFYPLRRKSGLLHVSPS